MGDTNERHVLPFLFECKEHIAQEKFYFIHRKESMNHLAMLGMGILDIPEIVLHLTPEHYVSGPLADHDPTRGGFVYVFGYLNGHRGALY